MQDARNTDFPGVGPRGRDVRNTDFPGVGPRGRDVRNTDFPGVGPRGRDVRNTDFPGVRPRGRDGMYVTLTSPCCLPAVGRCGLCRHSTRPVHQTVGCC